MKKSTSIILLLICTGVAVWWLFGRVGSPTSPPYIAGKVDEGRGLDAPTVGSGRPAGTVARENVRGRVSLPLGGAGLKLQSVYRDGLAALGTDDGRLASMVDTSRAMCSTTYAAEDEGWKDSSRNWAMGYLKSACEGFDADDYRYTGTTKNALWYMAKVGDKEATDAALSDIHRSDDMLQVGIASQYLIERDQLPDQAKYGLPKEELLKVASMASKLQTCGAMSACGSESLVTAELCARIGCPPGTAYVDAARRDLSPRQFEAMIKLRNFMSKR